jgi:hypothetical protein
MLDVTDLNLGSVDAINYKTKDEKEYFAKILYKENFLDEILIKKKYFLIGEKGTGKSSYSVFLHNSEYRDTLSRAISLTQTDYRRFASLTEQGKFSVSSYVEIWKVILLHLLSDGIANRFPDKILGFPRFKQLRDAMDEYYSSAFRPEVDQSLDIVENSEFAAKLMSKFFEMGGKESGTVSASFPSFQVNLAYLERRFKEAISSVKLNKDFILFIDGIDIRPDQIEYSSYIECIKGLANAAWEINTEFLSNIKDSKNHLKVMLLMRPDILDNMGFQNLNAKVHDNGVVLDWMTTYDGFRNSSIFKMICGILAKQQGIIDRPLVEVWNEYFPYDLDNMRVAEKADDPFVGFLRYSFYRPRDIIRYLQLMQEYVKKEEENKDSFTRESFFNCQRQFSDYLLGEVKDYLSFYHSTAEFDELVGFFSEFEGNNQVTWRQFQDAFHRHRVKAGKKNFSITELTSSAEDLLQLLYSLNILGYLEPDNKGGHFVHYCFRDRTTVKLRPKAPAGLQYIVHSGLQRALRVGGQTRKRHQRRRNKSR